MKLIQHFKGPMYVFLLMQASFNIGYAADKNSLSDIINSQHRDPINQARDSYRHPEQTLAFFGVKENMTVMEIWPGKGWYSELLAPWLKQGKGQFIAAGFPLNDGPAWRQSMQRDYQHWLALSPERYDQVDVVEFGPPSFWTLGKDESVDAILTFRNVHNWVKGGYENDVFTAMFRVLKSGGVLGITDHRAASGTDVEAMKTSGYLTEELVINLAEKAGFVFEASSEINANPLDNKDHPKGVWTLPPTLRLGEDNKQHYLAIGESDRMTLRFKKP
jgi:predicted methyltransferase